MHLQKPLRYACMYPCLNAQKKVMHVWHRFQTCTIEPKRMFLTIKMYEGVTSKNSVKEIHLQTAKIAWKLLEPFRIYTASILYTLIILYSVQRVINWLIMAVSMKAPNSYECGTLLKYNNKLLSLEYHCFWDQLGILN